MEGYVNGPHPGLAVNGVSAEVGAFFNAAGIAVAAIDGSGNLGFTGKIKAGTLTIGDQDQNADGDQSGAV